MKKLLLLSLVLAVMLVPAVSAQCEGEACDVAACDYIVNHAFENYCEDHGGRRDITCGCTCDYGTEMLDCMGFGMCNDDLFFFEDVTTEIDYYDLCVV